MTTRIHKLFNATSATSGSSSVLILSENPSDRDEFHLQADFTSTGTVAIEGRLADGMPWVTIESLTADALKVYSRFAQIRATISANGGNITITVAY